MKWAKKGLEPGTFLLKALFVLAAALVIIYIVWKWNSIVDYLSSLLFS